MAALRRAARFPGHERGDGLFVESLMAALYMTGSESTARVADFAAKRAAKVTPGSES
jgi:hypothetical protein